MLLDRIAVSGLVKTNLGDITCISVHLENQCSPIGRRKQMECLVRKLSQFEDYPETTIIGGDMNTVCTGLARFYAVNIFCMCISSTFLETNICISLE